MALGVMEAIRQAKREDIKFVLGGAGMKDIVKRVMDGDKMIPANVSYPPAMISTAMGVTAAHFYTNAPMRGTYVLNAAADHEGQREEPLLPQLAVLSGVLSPLPPRGEATASCSRFASGFPLRLSARHLGRSP